MSLIRVCIQSERIRRTIRGMLYRGLKRGGTIKLAEVARRVLARYPTDLDEAYTERLVREVAEDYFSRTRLK